MTKNTEPTYYGIYERIVDEVTISIASNEVILLEKAILLDKSWDDSLYLNIRIDRGSDIEELLETNNLLVDSIPILVQAADLLFDDTNNLSANKSSNFKENLRFYLSPNPVQNTLWLDIESPQKGAFNMAIYNAQQQLLTTEKVQLTKGQQRIKVQTDFLESGIYFLELTDNMELRMTKKIIKI